MHAAFLGGKGDLYAACDKGSHPSSVDQSPPQKWGCKGFFNHRKEAFKKKADAKKEQIPEVNEVITTWTQCSTLRKKLSGETVSRLHRQTLSQTRTPAAEAAVPKTTKELWNYK